VGQYQIFVGADTNSATSKLQSLDKVVSAVTKAKELKIKFPNTKTFERNIRNATKYASNGFKQLVNNADGLKDAFNNVKTAANPRSFLTGAFTGANVGAQTLLDKLAKISIALYGINSAAGILKGTFGSLFAQTIGQANAFEEQLLKTKTTLASTSDVFVNGQKITDPLKAIEALTGVIDERIESIRLRTIDIAGVTSGEVVEVFSIVASQAGQIGASLEDAENLAISFAAALGTFGLPLRQARQEITSILQGNINVDSYLAQALQITSQDIAKARSQVGGIAKFLEDKLSTAVAGQSIAAKTLGGVLSNVRDIWEEFTRSIGSSLLNPLIGSVTVFYDTLGDSLKTIKAIASEVGKVAANIGRGVANAAGFGSFDTRQLKALQQGVDQLLKRIQAAFAALSSNVTQLFNRIAGQLGAIFANIGAQVALIGEAFAALGEAVLVLTSAQIESFVGAVAQLLPILTTAIQGVAGLIKIWAELLKLPIVQSFVRIQTTLKVLEVTGVKGIVLITAKLVLLRAIILRTVKSVLAGVRILMRGIGIVIRGIGIVLKAIGGLIIAIQRVIRQITVVGVKLGLVSKKAAVDIKKAAVDIKKMSVEMKALGVSAQATGMKMGLLAKGVRAVGFAFKSLLRATIILAAVELALVGIVEAISAYQRNQAEAARKRDLDQAVKVLGDTAEKAANGGLSDLETRLREIAKAKVNDEIDKIATSIYQLDQAIEELEKRRDTRPVRNVRGGGNTRSRINNEIDDLKDKRAELEKQVAELRKDLGIDAEKDIVETAAKESKKLEKELAEFRKSLADDEFRYRQRLARAEVDRFRLQSRLELQRLETTLKKRLEGEEGASKIFLQNLNTYLLTKKRGEDEIAAREKELQITLGNLQKEIADYKYNTEKKIADLQKKMGKYQMEVADYRLKKMRQQASESSGGTQDGNFGNDVIGKLTAAIVSKESSGNYNAVNKDTKATGIGQVIPSNIGPWTEKYYGERLNQEQFKNNPTAQNAVVRGQIKDYFLAQKNQGFSDEEASRRVAAQWYSGNPNLANNTRPQYSNGNEYPSIASYADDIVKRMGTTSTTSTPAEPEAPSLDLGDVDPSAITASLEKMKSVLGEVNALKDEITSEDIAARFEAIGQGVFGEVNLEPLQDQLNTVNALFQQTAESAKSLNASSKAEIEYQTLLSRKAEEKKQIFSAIDENTKLSDEEKKTLQDAINASYDQYIQKLGEAQKLKQNILATTEAQAALEQIVAQTQQIEAQTMDNMLRLRLEMEGLDEIQIAAELRKAEIARRYAEALEAAEKAGDPKKVDELREAWEKLNNVIDKNAQSQQQLVNPLLRLQREWKRDLKNVDGLYTQLAQTVQSELGSALSNAISGVIDGTSTVEEAFSQMFKNIGKAFIDLATQMIAKALVLKALGILFPGGSAAAGGGFSFSGGSVSEGLGNANLLGGTGALNPSSFGFRANGGPVTGGKPYVVGERGPELFVPGASGQVINNEDTQAFADAARSLRNPGSRSAETADEEAFSVAANAISRNSQVINNRQITTQQETSFNTFADTFADTLRQSTTNQENSFNTFADTLLKSGQSTVKFETINVGDMPMVTRDEALRIGAQSAKAAEAAVFNALKNKPSVRRSVGMT